MKPETPADTTILIVEDNEAARSGLAHALRLAGYAVALAANGQEALSRLRGGLKPALILLDMLTPVLDGWHFLELWGRDAALPRAPVVILTGIGVATPEWATSLGAAGYLGKPVEADDLLLEVSRCLRGDGRPPVAAGAGMAHDLP